MIRTVTSTRYVAPLREGGSLPGLIEANDGGLYVVKFRGAGQGPKVLVAELVCGELARLLGLPVPEIVFIEVDPALGRNEPDGEIHDLVSASGGLNLGMAFLPGALAFDPLSVQKVASGLASAIVWFDAFTMNVDRTPRNPNLILHQRQLWLIDHGAALYVAHSWDDRAARARSRFAVIKDHVLLPTADALAEADAVLAPQITADVITALLALVPTVWLTSDATFPDAEDHRAAYAAYLNDRIAEPRVFLEEALRARAERL